jgi:hypothetical protein
MLQVYYAKEGAISTSNLGKSSPGFNVFKDTEELEEIFKSQTT